MGLLRVLLASSVMGCAFSETVETDPVEWNKPFSRLTIDSDAGDLTITGGDTEILSGEITSTYVRASPEVTWRLGGPEDDELEVTVSCGLSDSECEVDMTLTVPSEIGVLLDTKLGDVSLMGIVGNVTLTTKEGNISALDIVGEVGATTRSGDVSVEGLSGARTIIDVEEGSVAIEQLGLFNVVHGASQLGDVQITVPEGLYNVVTSPAPGGVTVEGVDIDATASARIEATALDGSIVILGVAGGS